MMIEISDVLAEVKPSNKARIQQLIPKINELRGQGVTLTNIFTWLKEKGHIDCQKSNFDKYYYFFNNQIESQDNSQNTDSEKHP